MTTDAVVSVVVGVLRVSWILIITPWQLIGQSIRRSVHGLYLVGKEARK